MFRSPVYYVLQHFPNDIHMKDRLLHTFSYIYCSSTGLESTGALLGTNSLGLFFRMVSKWGESTRTIFFTSLSPLSVATYTDGLPQKSL